MTITKDTSAPLFAVVGATGGQGGSTIRALKASSKPYRVRAITRDASKPLAKTFEELGCEVVEADVYASADEAKKAFEGADIAFIMTLSDFSDSGRKEYEAAVIQIDAAKAAGVKTLVWSGMPHVSNLTGGKSKVPHVENKADATAYARSLDGLRVIDVQPGSFFSNFFTHTKPRKLEDGSFIIAMTIEADSLMPVIDIDEDYGKYVVGALENGSVDTVHAAPEYITPTRVAECFAKASGKKVAFCRMPDEQFLAVVSSFQGEVGAKNMLAMFRGFREAGYFVGADLGPSNEILSAPARKLDEMLAGNQKRVAELFS